jgi:hypothetical protein
MSIVGRLPQNFMMEAMGLDATVIKMSFTLTTLEHVAALKEVLDLAVIPMLRDSHQPTDTGSVT